MAQVDSRMETLGIVEQSVKLNRKGAEMLTRRLELQDQMIAKTMAELRDLILLLHTVVTQVTQDKPLQ